MAGLFCPQCGAPTPTGTVVCPQCGRPLAALTFTAPLSSGPGSVGPTAASGSSDLFDGVPGVVFRQSLDQPFLGSFQILDGHGRVLGLLKRYGAGVNVFMMNFVLQDAARRPIFLFQQPSPRPGIHFGGVWTLAQPDGTTIGQLSYRPGFGRSTVTLSYGTSEPLTGVKPAWAWSGYPVRQGARTVATVRVQWPALPGGIFLDFLPTATIATPRAFIVALVAWGSIWTQSPQFPRWPLP